MPQGALPKHGHCTTSHGRYTRTYAIYQRCKHMCQPNYRCRQHYYDRGIKFEWQTFEEFLVDMGRAPEWLYESGEITRNQRTLRRKNPYRNFNKANCYWGLPVRQRREKRGMV